MLVRELSEWLEARGILLKISQEKLGEWVIEMGTDDAWSITTKEGIGLEAAVVEAMDTWDEWNGGSG